MQTTVLQRGKSELKSHLHRLNGGGVISSRRMYYQIDRYINRLYYKDPEETVRSTDSSVFHSQYPIRTPTTLPADLQ